MNPDTNSDPNHVISPVMNPIKDPFTNPVMNSVTNPVLSLGWNPNTKPVLNRESHLLTTSGLVSYGFNI